MIKFFDAIGNPHQKYILADIIQNETESNDNALI